VAAAPPTISGTGSPGAAEAAGDFFSMLSLPDPAEDVLGWKVGFEGGPALEADGEWSNVSFGASGAGAGLAGAPFDGMGFP